MKKIDSRYLVASVILYLTILYAKIFNTYELAKTTIPVFVFMFFAFTVYVNSFKPKGYIFLCLAAFFTFTGDFLINLTQVGQFSVLSFIFTHICLSTYYIIDTKIHKQDFLKLIPVFVVSLLLAFYIFPMTVSVLEKIVFVVYLTVLSIMVWRAICFIGSGFSAFKITCVVLGSIMFYFTDISVMLGTLTNEKFYVISTWVLYPPALVLLSLMNSKEKPVLK